MDVIVLILAGLAAIQDYVLAHTLFCLIPAFFIAGAMAALIPKRMLLPYLGKDSPKHVAYPIAVASGLLLAVCSCTVLPLFAGIRKGGAGIGPAIVFLYTAPATNIMAILYTGSLIGWDIALARIILSIAFAVIIGLIISKISDHGAEKEGADAFEKHAGGPDTKRLFLLFGALLGILLVGTRISEDFIKYPAVAGLIILTLWISSRYFTREEVSGWMDETWGFAKTIAPLLLIGVFASGIIREVMPPDLIPTYMGQNTLIAMVIPVLFGIFVYFPTLVEVPMARMFLDLGMAKGPLLAYMLADPVISLPSILVVRKIMGNRDTGIYVLLIFVLSVLAGLGAGQVLFS
ncbi:permease [Candidatus Micrarchaeota archaeon]|nr:permease [Candidatus Micrarchaeota archaeon]